MSCILNALVGAKCISLCNAVKITDLSSGNLCRRNFDYGMLYMNRYILHVQKSGKHIA